MSSWLTIVKDSPVPIYRQIVLGVTRRVQDGLLAPGEALPSERELAGALGVARGTVARAYDELTRSHILESAAGRGSRVSSRQDVLPESRKARALQAMNELVSTLLDLRFTYREIRTLFDLTLMEREARRRQLCIAAVDCNPEALSIFERQLGFLARVVIRKVLLDAALSPNGARSLSAFDLVLTTSTHVDELGTRHPALRDRLLRAIVSPSPQTILDLAAIASGRRVGIATQSDRFREIILRTLADLSIPASRVASARLGDAAAVARLLQERDVVIVPSGCSLLAQSGLAPALQTFTQRDGRVIPFAYQIERGSLLHIEERIRDLLTRQPEGDAGP